MPTAGTIELGGVGYPVVAGTYQRAALPADPPRSGRVEIRDFRGGMRQAVMTDTSTGGWEGKAVGPVLGGAGVEPWTTESVHADTMADLPTLTQRAHSVVAGSQVYIGIGRRLYRTGNLTDTSWSSLTAVADMGVGMQITGVANIGDEIICMLGPWADAKKYVPTTATTAVWRSGERASVGIGYQGQLIYAPKTPAYSGNAANLDKLKLSLTRYTGAAATDVRWLDGPIVSMGLFRGQVAIATRSSLFLLGGQPDPGEADDPNTTGDQSRRTEWRGDPEAVFSHGTWTAESDFTFLVGFRGKLWTWLANEVQCWSPEDGAWVRTGLVGTSCYGGVVAAGFLVVSLVTRSGQTETWASDGDGWWRIHVASSASAERVWPVALNGVGNNDLLLFRDGSATYDLYRLVWRSSSLHAYRPSAEWVSSLLDAGDRTAAKSWRTVGATFSLPEIRGNSASTDAVTITLDASFDAGSTWSTVATQTVSSPAARVIDLTGVLPTGSVARWLQLRVSWSSVLDWAPVLTGVWADWTALPQAMARRQWHLAVRCADRQLTPSGAPLAATGRDLSTALWAAWEGNTALTFKDIDHDALPVTRSVSITAIEERVATPADAGRWGESVIRLDLIER